MGDTGAGRKRMTVARSLVSPFTAHVANQIQQAVRTTNLDLCSTETWPCRVTGPSSHMSWSMHGTRQWKRLGYRSIQATSVVCKQALLTAPATTPLLRLRSLELERSPSPQYVSAPVAVRLNKAAVRICTCAWYDEARHSYMDIRTTQILYAIADHEFSVWNGVSPADRKPSAYIPQPES